MLINALSKGASALTWFRILDLSVTRLLLYFMWTAMAEDDVAHRLIEWGLDDSISPFQGRRIFKLHIQL